MGTINPIVKMTTLKGLLSIATMKGWFLHQLDINMAFLHGDLNEVVYMKIPPNFHIPSSSLVCKLQKSLYGLK